jgi:hypothetical protein
MATNINVDKIKLKNPPKKLKSTACFGKARTWIKLLAKYALRKSGSTSNLMQHMKRKHDVDLFGKLFNPCPGLPEISLISTTVSRYIFDIGIDYYFFSKV